MTSYQIALVVTIEAESYDQALRDADNLAEGIGNDGENIYAVHDYEEDAEEQRVLYLPSVENEPVSSFREEALRLYAFAEGVTTEIARPSFDRKYEGYFLTMVEFAQHVASSSPEITSFGCSFSSPEAWPYRYIDWNAAADELRVSYKIIPAESNNYSGFFAFRRAA